MSKTEQHSVPASTGVGENHKETGAGSIAQAVNMGSCILFSPGRRKLQDGGNELDRPKMEPTAQEQHTQDPNQLGGSGSGEA